MIVDRPVYAVPSHREKAGVINRFSDAAAYLLFAVLSLVPLHWFKAGDIVDAIDMGLPFNAGRLLHEYSSVWDSKLFAGTDFSHLVSMLFPYYAYFAIAERMLGVEWAQRLEFVALFFLMFSCAFYAARRFGFRPLAGIATALLYVFNFYVMTMFHEGFILIGLAYAFLPVNVVLLRRIFSGYRVRRSLAVLVLISAFYAASASSAITIVVVLAVPAVVCAIVYGHRLSLQKNLLRLAACFGGYALMNAFWLLPMLAIHGGMGKHHLEFNINDWPTVVKPLSTFDTLRMLNWDVYADILSGTPYWTSRAYFTTSPVAIIVTGLLAVLPLLLFFLRGGRKRAVFLALYAVGLLGSLGFGPPFGDVFGWLVRNVPGFFILRSTNIHFGSLEAFGAAFALGMMLDTLKFERARAASFAVGCVALIVATLPMWSGSVMEPARGIAPSYNWSAPSFYKKLDDEMASLPDGARTAILPQQYAVYAAYKWGAWTEDPIVYWLSHDFITWPSVTNARSGAASSYDAIVDTLGDLVYTGDPAQARVGLWALGVRQVVYRSDIDKRFYSWQSADAEQQLLSSMPFLRTPTHIGPLAVYAVAPSSAPHAYHTSNVISGIFPFLDTQQPNAVYIDDLHLDSARGVLVAAPPSMHAASRRDWEHRLKKTDVALRWKDRSYFEATAPRSGTYRLSGMLSKDLAALVLAGVSRGVTRNVAPLWDDESGRYIWLRQGERLRITWTDPSLPNLRLVAVPQFERREMLPTTVRVVYDSRGHAQRVFRLDSGDFFMAFSDGAAPMIFGQDNRPLATSWLNDDLVELHNPSGQMVSTVSPGDFRVFAPERAESKGVCSSAKIERRYAWLYSVSAPSCAVASAITLSESFDRDWLLTGAQGAQHVTGNGYANTWLVPAGTPVSGYIVYWPQFAFLVGIVLSVLSFLCCVSIVVVGRGRLHG